MNLCGCGGQLCVDVSERTCANDVVVNPISLYLISLKISQGAFNFLKGCFISGQMTIHACSSHPSGACGSMIV